MARKQIREKGEQGDGLALAGLIVGYVFTGFYLVGCAIWIAALGVVASAGTVS